MILPFAHYTYQKSTYQITGIEFILGKQIMGGRAYVPPQKLFWLIVFFAVAAIFLAVIGNLGNLNLKTFGRIMMALSFLQLICGIVFAFFIGNTLSETKRPGLEFGVLIMMFVVAFSLGLAIWILYQLKFLSALDFMVLAGLTYMLINNYLPLIGISIAFKKIDYSLGIWKSPWHGFKNFEFLFQTSDAYIITRNTILYNVVFIVLSNTMGVLTGIALSEVFSKKLQKTYQTLILLPQLISYGIVAYIVFGFLSNEAGFINKTLLREAEINFYNDPKYWPYILTFVHVWKGLGYGAIIYFSAIIGIDRNLYDAAKIDGCGRVRVIKNITLPLIKPTIYTLVMLQIGRIFYSDFGLFYQVPMNAGPLYTVTTTIDVYVYRALITLNNIAMASASSTYQAIVGFVLILIVNLIVRKKNKDHALF